MYIDLENKYIYIYISLDNLCSNKTKKDIVNIKTYQSSDFSSSGGKGCHSLLI